MAAKTAASTVLSELVIKLQLAKATRAVRTVNIQASVEAITQATANNVVDGVATTDTNWARLVRVIEVVIPALVSGMQLHASGLTQRKTSSAACLTKTSISFIV